MDQEEFASGAKTRLLLVEKPFQIIVTLVHITTLRQQQTLFQSVSNK